jgi:nucleoside recognition membrane protein YjiH
MLRIFWSGRFSRLKKAVLAVCLVGMIVYLVIAQIDSIFANHHSDHIWLL